jgi:hypothetical protein
VGGIYLFHAGYWGAHVGFYGGINYGYGYFGSGFAGGRWVGNSFAYNKAVSNVGDRVALNTYSEPVASDAALKNVSYNGGPGGASATPTAAERAADSESHMSATPRQREIVLQSARNPELMARTNNPDRVVAATEDPAVIRSPPRAVKADNSHAVTAGGTHGRSNVRPIATLHSQNAAERPVTQAVSAHTQDEGDSRRTAAPKPTRATHAKPVQPK